MAESTPRTKFVPPRGDRAAELQRLWDAAQAPDISAFVRSNPLSAVELGVVLRVDQRGRWRGGERVRAEDYLQRFPAVLEHREGAVDLIFNEFLLREECGAAQDLEEFLRRFPEFAGELRAQIELHRALAPSTQDAPTKSDPARTDAARPTAAGASLGFLAPPRQEGELGWLGRYRVLAVLGQGGMGIVLRAWDTRLERLVALKVLRADGGQESESRQRFEREARAIAALQHDHIVQIFDVGAEAGVPFLAMPLLSGESLEDRLKRARRLPLEEVLRIARETALGLAAAHEHGVIHRDVKPANLWLESSGARVKILDFGLARTAAADARVTQSGCILGTPAYMAPEQARGKVVDARGDLFSLGCVLYRLCTGELPFKGDDAMSVLLALSQDYPRLPILVDPNVPPALSDLIMRLLAKDPHERPPTAHVVVDAIREIESVALARPARNVPSKESASRGERGLRAAAFAGVVIVGAVLTIWLVRDRQVRPKTSANDEAWTTMVADLPPEEQAEAVVAMLKKRNPDFDGTFTREINQGKVTELAFITDNVPDISPVAALKDLQVLDCRGNPYQKGSLTDLAPLAGMKLTTLKISGTKVADLTPLAGTKLAVLACYGTPVSDLTPLQGLPLTHLDCGDTAVSKLTPLKNLKLVELAIDGTAVSDLTPLQDMKLMVFTCTRTRVADLTPLQAMPLKQLRCDPQLARASQFLRAISTLEQINGQAAADFWKE